MEQISEPYMTLFSNLSLGMASRPYGYQPRSSAAASFTTFWNIQARCPSGESSRYLAAMHHAAVPGA